MEQTVTAVGVIDKAIRVLDEVRTRPCSLRDLVAATGMSKATAHRIATSLEQHGLLRRDAGGHFHVGLGVLAYAAAARSSMPLDAAARPALARLRDLTGESAQLYVPSGGRRICLVSLESPHGLRTIVRAGESLPLERGSGGRVLARSNAGAHDWVESVGEREPGVASVSAPVVDREGDVVAAVSISGPIDRMGMAPGRRHGGAVVAAAHEVELAAGFG